MSSPNTTIDLNATPRDDTPYIQSDAVRLSVESFGLTDRGLVRPSNEDQFLVATLFKALQVKQTSLKGSESRHSSDRSHLFIVADGMGGAAAGETASALALDFVETYVLETLQWFACCRPSDEDRLLSEFTKALSQAHTQVRREAAEQPKLRGMGTTVTLAYSLNEVLFVAHVGDSRCYLLREKRLHRLTQDHTLVEEMVKSGALTPEAAAKHRWRHVITSTVGGNSADVRVDVHRLHMQAGDQVLLCSDGLTNMVSDEEIVRILEAPQSPEEVCRKLIAFANEKGGKDNITVIVARYAPEA
ncbi:MAG: Stp1/IreP family PP2C-type Ser/Thr phosphatase [Pirellulaceae bacterium]|nr:Stp1/IreP family PP2C-type Ser/Thr phosphatase [Pirellulaceae bacterium]